MRCSIWKYNSDRTFYGIIQQCWIGISTWTSTTSERICSSLHSRIIFWIELTPRTIVIACLFAKISLEQFYFARNNHYEGLLHRSTAAIFGAAEIPLPTQLRNRQLIGSAQTNTHGKLTNYPLAKIERAIMINSLINGTKLTKIIIKKQTS